MRGVTSQLRYAKKPLCAALLMPDTIFRSLRSDQLGVTSLLSLTSTQCYNQRDYEKAKFYIKDPFGCNFLLFTLNSAKKNSNASLQPISLQIRGLLSKNIAKASYYLQPR